MNPFGLPPPDTRCDLCTEPEYLFGLCYRHLKEKYVSEDHDQEPDDWTNDDQHNDPRHTPYSHQRPK